jgi:RHS repeat-associated protein
LQVPINKGSSSNTTNDGKYATTYWSNGRINTITWTAGATTNTVTYNINALGQRLRKVTPSSVVGTRRFMYDEAGRLAGEYDSAGKLIQETVWFNELPIATLRPVAGSTTTPIAINTFYVHADHLGTPRVITRPSDNKIMWKWDTIEAFGNSPPNENPAAGGSFIYNLCHPGQQWDKETNHFYNYFRDYDASTGRYVQSDPIGLAGGINTYGYVNANPLKLVDPTGEFGFVGGLGSAGFELFAQLSLNGFELQCVDWGDVAAAGFIGFFVPRPLQELGRIRKGFGASVAYQTQLVNARSASSAAKIRSRLSRANGEMLGGLGNTTYSVGAKTAVKDIMPPSGSCKKEDSCGGQQ